MKRTLARAVLIGAFVAAPALATVPANAASEVCGSGHVNGTPLPLPSCRNCPPGVSVGPSGVNPFVSVYVCANP